jgi:hypothetical protein
VLLTGSLELADAALFASALPRARIVLLRRSRPDQLAALLQAAPAGADASGRCGDWRLGPGSDVAFAADAGDAAAFLDEYDALAAHWRQAGLPIMEVRPARQSARLSC